MRRASARRSEVVRCREAKSVPGVRRRRRDTRAAWRCSRRRSGPPRRAATRSRSSGTTTGVQGVGSARADRASTRRSPPSRARPRSKAGDAEAAIAGAAKKLEAAYEFPYPRARRHGADELRGQARRDEACEVWNGEQFQTGDQFAIAKCSGLKPEQVKLNMLYAGGSFGRRANPQSDYVRRSGRDRRARLIRAEDRRPGEAACGRARTTCAAATTGRCTCHALRAALDDDGKVVAMAASHRRPVDPRGHARSSR